MSCVLFEGVHCVRKTRRAPRIILNGFSVHWSPELPLVYSYRFRYGLQQEKVTNRVTFPGAKEEHIRTAQKAGPNFEGPRKLLHGSPTSRSPINNQILRSVGADHVTHNLINENPRPLVARIASLALPMKLKKRFKDFHVAAFLLFTPLPLHKSLRLVTLRYEGTIRTQMTRDDRYLTK